MSATSYHRGDAYLSYHLLLLGAGFPSLDQLQGYCDGTVSSLWEIAPFAMARSTLSIWVMAADASLITRSGSGEIVGLDSLAIRSVVGQMQDEDPAVPPWSAWTDGMKLRAGVVVVDFEDRGYEDLLGSSAPATRSLARRVPIGSAWSDSGAPSAQAFVTMAALPFGGSHIPDDPQAYRATAGQLAKAIGLLLRLGDELAIGSETFEGDVGALPLNLDSPPLYPSDPIRTDTGTSRALSPELVHYWRLRGDRRGSAFKRVSGSTLEVRSSEVAVVHSSLGLIPDSPLVAPSGVAAMLSEGVHLVEGGGGYRFGVYRARANCVMRFPWRYHEPSSRWDAAEYCPVCRQQVQSILVGYGDYRLGQYVVDAGSIDEDADRDLGALLAQHVAAEGGDQPALASFAQASSRVAALARISQFFGTQTRLNKGRTATFRVVAGGLELLDDVPEGEDAVRLPMIRNAVDSWAEVFWASNYNAVFTEMYPDAERRGLTLLLCGGIAAAVEVFGLGEVVNTLVDDGPVVRWGTLDAERARALRPGAVIELFETEDAAVAAVVGNDMESLREDRRRTLILVERTEDGVRLASHVSSEITDDPELGTLRDGWGYVLGANWYGYSRGIRTSDARTGAEVRAGVLARDEIRDRLNHAVWAEDAGLPDFPTKDGPRTVADYIASGDYLSDANFLLERVKRRALELVRLPLPVIAGLLQRVRARYLEGDAIAVLDDLAFGLDLVLPTRGSARGMVVLTEHLHPDEVVGASLPEFVGPYPSPPPVLETTVGIGADAATLYDDSDVNEFAEAIVAQRGLVLSDEDAWVFVRNRHPVLFLLQRESVAGRRALSTSDWVRIRDMLTPNPALSPAADLTARRAALRTWVLETVESVESALAGVRSATDAAAETPPLRTEDLPSLGDTLAAILNYGFGLYFPLATLLPGSDTPEVWTLFRKALYIALDEEVPEADYAKLHLRLRSAFLEALAPGGNWEAFKEAVAPVWIAFNLLLFVVLLASVVGAPEAAVAAEPLAAAATEAAVAEVGILEVIALGVDIVDFYVSWKDLEGALADAEFGDVNRIHALNDFLYSRGLNDLSVIRTVNDDTWDDGLFFAASAIGLWASWDALRRAGRIPPRSAVDVPVTEGAPLALVRLAASRYVSFVEETKDLPKAMLKKTLATDLVQTLSGWASRLVPSWVARTTDARAVRAYSETLAEYEPTVHKFLDHGEPGLFAACHAEKQLALHHVWAGATDPIAITRATCGDCRRFLRAVAQKEGKRVIVADPDWVRSYEPSGKVFIYHHEGDLKTIVDELTAPEAKLFSRTDEVW